MLHHFDSYLFEKIYFVFLFNPKGSIYLVVLWAYSNKWIPPINPIG